jgi:hypothetical protein
LVLIERILQPRKLRLRPIERGDIHLVQNLCPSGECTSCMENQSPGSPDLAVLSFTNGFHGRMFASLSTQASRRRYQMKAALYADSMASEPLSAIHTWGIP